MYLIRALQVLRAGYRNGVIVFRSPFGRYPIIPAVFAVKVRPFRQAQFRAGKEVFCLSDQALFGNGIFLDRNNSLRPL